MKSRIGIALVAISPLLGFQAEIQRPPTQIVALSSRLLGAQMRGACGSAHGAALLFTNGRQAEIVVTDASGSIFTRFATEEPFARIRCNRNGTLLLFPRNMDSKRCVVVNETGARLREMVPTRLLRDVYFAENGTFWGVANDGFAVLKEDNSVSSPSSARPTPSEPSALLAMEGDLFATVTLISGNLIVTNPGTGRTEKSVALSSAQLSSLRGATLTESEGILGPTASNRSKVFSILARYKQSDGVPIELFDLQGRLLNRLRLMLPILGNETDPQAAESMFLFPSDMAVSDTAIYLFDRRKMRLAVYEINKDRSIW